MGIAFGLFCSLVVGEFDSRAVGEHEIGEICGGEECRYIFACRGCLGEALEIAYSLEGVGAVGAGKGNVGGEAGDGGIVGVGEGVFYSLNLSERLVDKIFEPVKVIVPRVFVACRGGESQAGKGESADICCCFHLSVG